MKKITHFTILIVFVFIALNFTKDSSTNTVTINNYRTNGISTALTEEESNSQNFKFPFLGSSFNGFKETLAFKESQGKYHIVNTYGHLGKYQFGKTTLERFKIYNTSYFLKNPELQENAFIALCSLNKWILRKDISRSVGKKMNGIVITESGILAAAHLAGAGNVKKYLRKNNTFKDAYGSSIQNYIKKFNGYDTSFIEASKKPTV